MVRDSNNSLQTAKRLGLNPLGVVQRDTLGQDDRIDYYRFRLDRSSLVTLALRQFTGSARVELIDNSREPIPLDTYQGPGIDVLLSGSLAEGDYYLRVLNSGTSTRYRLSVNSIEYPVSDPNLPPPNTSVFVSINFGRPDANPTDLVVVGNALYFAADNGINGQELFRISGRRNNLTRFDINQQGRGQGSDPRDLVNLNGTLYFTATDGFSGRELYRLGANERTPTRIADLNPGEVGSDPAGLTVFNNQLFFTADRDNGLGRELYRTDGTADGIRLVSDINSGEESSNPTDFAIANNTLYFAATRDDVGRELFASSGTDSRLVFDLNFGRTDDIPTSSIPTDLINVNNVLYFAATDDLRGRELWRYDPVNNPTVRPQTFTNLSTSDNAASPGSDLTALTVTDFASIDTFLAARPNRNRSAIAAINNTIYFAATSREFGRELFSSEGRFASIALVGNINENGSSNPTNLTTLNNQLFFAASAGNVTGNELYRYNPRIRRANRRLVRIADINVGAGGSDPADFVLYRNQLIFAATSSLSGRELRSFPLRPNS